MPPTFPHTDLTMPAHEWYARISLIFGGWFRVSSRVPMHGGLSRRAQVDSDSPPLRGAGYAVFKVQGVRYLPSTLWSNPTGGRPSDGHSIAHATYYFKNMR